MVSAFEAGSALCAPFLSALPVTGASISVVSADGAQSTIGTTDPVSVRLEELQFQLGEGPTPDVIRAGVPSLSPDLTAGDVLRAWPLFGEAAIGTGARALFSFPLRIGPMTVGVVSLYAVAVQPRWPEALLRAALGLVARTVQPAVGLAMRAASTESWRPAGQHAETRREVHQASGMVMVQLSCSVEDALARIRAYSFAAGRPVDAVARDVIDRTLRFDPLDD